MALQKKNKVAPENMYNGMRVVAIAMQKGGVGKSTLALHLGIRAALGHIPEIKKKVLIIDVDEQQNTSKTLLKMETVENEGYTLPPIHEDYDPEDPEDVEWGGRSNSVDLYYGNPVLPYTSQVCENLDIIPSDGMVLKDFNDIKDKVDVNLLEAIYDEMYKFFSSKDVQEEYDLVIFDCPPGKTLITTPVMRSATDLLLPTEAEMFSMDGVHRMMRDVLNENNFRVCDVNVLGIFPNKFRGSINKHKAGLEVLQNSTETGPYMAPFAIKNLTSIGFDQLPKETVNADYKLKDKVGESEIKRFISYVRHKMFGTEFK